MSGTAGLQTAIFIVGQNPDARAGALYPTVQVSVSEALGVDGRIFLKFSVAVVRSTDGQVADLRGLFFNLTGTGLLGGLAVSGPDVTSKDFSGSANNLGGGVNINGGGPDSYHIGLAFGTQGIGSDDIRFTEFSLKHNSPDPSQPAQDLRVGLLTSQNFAARLTSVGPESHREGSLKLLGQLPVGAVTGLPQAPTEPTSPGTGSGETMPPGTGGETTPPGGDPTPDYGDDLPGTCTEPTAHLGDGNDSFWGSEGPDRVAGGPRNDVLMGNGGDDQLAGGAGDDTIDGHNGSDTLCGGDGNDRLHGLAGNDVLLAGAGNDLLEGGDGQDQIIGGDGDDAMQGEGGDDTLIGGSGADTLEGNAGRDLLIGGSGSDHLAGHDEDDTLVGGADAGTVRLVDGRLTDPIPGDRIYGDGGADLFIYRQGDGVDLLPDFKPSEGDRLVIHGYAAFTAVARIGATTVLYLDENAAIVLTDAYPATSLAGPFPGVTFVPNPAPTDLTAAALIAAYGRGLPPNLGAEGGTGDGGSSGGTTAGGMLRGTPGADRLIAHGWNNRIEAEGGDDTIDGGEGNAVIDAGDGRNVIGVWGWNNTVRAGDGGSVLTGPHGNTTVTFGNGDHVVMLSGWSNTVTLGTGNSIVDAGDGNSTIEISGGHNTVVLRGFGNRIITGGGDDTISGIAGNSVVEAGGGNNRVTAAGYANQITTGDGDDVVVAGNGSAVVHAGGGRDVIGLAGWGNHVWAGAGDDVVLLGPGDGDGNIDGGAGWDTLLLPGTAAAYRFAQDPEGFVHVWGPGARSYRLLDVEGVGFDGDSGTMAALADVLAAVELSEMAAMSTGGAPSYVLPDLYTGPVAYLRYQLLGTVDGEAVVATSQNDFLNLLDGDDAAQSGLGDDVLDGGTGSNFLTGGRGWDTFFVDGRGGGPTWSTITDWEASEHLSIWGWRPGVSRSLWQEQAGASGWEGATLHMDLDGNGSWDTSVTWSGIARAALPQSLEYDGLLWFA